MNLAIFDLDGTLTDTNAVDSECFLRAWKETHGNDCSVSDWSSFADVSDRGIAKALCERYLPPEEREMGYERFKSAFLTLLASAIERPESCRAIPGAIELMAILPSRGWRAVVATGAWRASAEIKLKAAGFPRDVPLTASDDLAARCDIVRAAIRLASQIHGASFDRVTLLGDAPWDVAAAAELRLPFVGRASGSARDRLVTAGAETILRDYSNFDAVENFLRTAAVPGRAAAAIAGPTPNAP